jgi:ribosome-associated protein
LPSARFICITSAPNPIDGVAVPLDISTEVAIPDDELEWKFIRSSGPGGQNVNKVASAVQLRFLLPQNKSIPGPAKFRLRRMAGQRLVDDGTVLISARDERSQEQNRRAALERLADLIRAALIEPKIRRKTRPTRASKERRIESKKRRSSTKRDRGGRWD